MTRAPFWLGGCLALAIPLVLPFAVVAAAALLPAGPAWEHLTSTVLPDYVSATFQLLVLVAIGVVVIGVATAWFVTAYEFPGRRLLEWSLLLPLAAKRGVSIRIDEPAASALLDVDGSQLQQALANLVVNGVQAMNGGGTVSVGIAHERTCPPQDDGAGVTPCLRVSVRDEGPGIARVDLEHVFEPFFTTKGIGEGTGLGLSVAREIVREHGGWIDVQTDVGRGSCFSIYLPIEGASCQAAS